MKGSNSRSIKSGFLLLLDPLQRGETELLLLLLLIANGESLCPLDCENRWTTPFNAEIECFLFRFSIFKKLKLLNHLQWLKKIDVKKN